MIDLKPEYLDMGERRISEGETGISTKEQQAGQMALKFERTDPNER